MTKHRHELPHSSSIQCCEYDEDSKEMHITFSSGGRHCFKEVDKETYDGLHSSKSPGSYFHTNIRRIFKSIKAD